MKLTVKELTYTYRGGHAALRNVSFEARQGELLSVLGPNGAGKSTLFRCILGGLPDYGGAILLDGRDARTLDQRTLAAHIAYIPQIHRPTFGYSVLDTVLMGLTRQLSPFRSPSAQQEQQALATLEQLGVVHLTYRNFAELSGGAVAAFGATKEVLTAELLRRLYGVDAALLDTAYGPAIVPKGGEDRVPLDG